MPVETLFVVPLAPLCKLAAHEEQFLSGMRPHICVERAEVRELLLAREVNAFEVLATAELIRSPAPGGSAVIEVEHRGDGVNTQPVNVALAEPEERVGDEKISDLVATVVENVRAPIGMLAETRVFV